MSSTHTTHTTHYQPRLTRRMRGLDGIRALAVIAVLIYHLIPGVAQGGFLGVDVFFVLSGFLITSLLVKEHQRHGRIDLKAFWLRRVRRLLPAVATMALVTLVVAGLVNKDILVNIGAQFLGVLTFSYNWVEIIRGASYFDQANPHLWTNVWSLAVEQQFYLIWPLIVLLIFRLKATTRPLIPAALVVVSAGLMALYTLGAADFSRAYMGTDSHAFGLMLGAFFALAVPNALDRGGYHSRYPQQRGLIGVTSLGVIIACFFLIPDDQSWVYPWGTLLASLAMLGLLQGLLGEVYEVRGAGRALTNLLELLPLRWIGVRSYGIYLWHWPIYVVVNNQFPDMSIAASSSLIITLSVVCAALSFHFIEEPMRVEGIFATLRSWFAPSAARRRPLAMAVSYAAVLMLVFGGAVVLTTAPEKTGAQQLIEQGIAAKKKNEKAGKNTQDVKGLSQQKKKQLKKEVSLEKLLAGKPKRGVLFSGKNVSAVGDSVILAATPQLYEALPGIDIDAAVSRAFGAGLDVVSAKARDGSLREYVVMGLSTNGVITTAQLDQTLKVIGKKRTLIMITGYGPQRDTWIFDANDNIHAFAKKYPNRVKVVDWYRLIKDCPEYLAPDKVHPEPIGGRLLANALAYTLLDINDGKNN